MELDPSVWTRTSRQPSEDLYREPYLSEVVLTDGGVYDNLGLETAWKRYKTILVSNGGGKMQPEPDPHGDWARHALRVNDIIDNQVRSLRARQVILSFEAKEREGEYWGIRTDIRDYALPDCLSCDFESTTALANTPTRLKRLDDVLQERLINWGYAVCDAAMRKHVITAAPRNHSHLARTSNPSTRRKLGPNRKVQKNAVKRAVFDLGAGGPWLTDQPRGALVIRRGLLFQTQVRAGGARPRLLRVEEVPVEASEWFVRTLRP